MKVLYIRDIETFKNIVSGYKSIEIRLCTNFTKLFKVGEEVIFVCKDNKCVKKIKYIWYEKSFYEMFKKLNKRLTDINPKLKDKNPLQFYEMYYPNKLNFECFAFEVCNV